VEAFGVVVIVVALVAAVAAIVSFVGSGTIYKNIGKGAFSLDQPDRPKGPAPGSSAYRAEAEAEVRQMVQAKSDLREARGEDPLDVEAEVRELLQPRTEVDPELREEVRQLVEARNHRRMARGEPPLDVDEEVERQLRDLGA
jgi:hypothetical protein